MIEIPQEHIEAWRKARGTRETLPSRLADAFVWALAGWERERFEREHKMIRGWTIGSQVDVCANHSCCLGEHDPRHTWAPEQWQQSVREGLEKAE